MLAAQDQALQVNAHIAKVMNQTVNRVRTSMFTFCLQLFNEMKIKGHVPSLKIEPLGERV